MSLRSTPPEIFELLEILLLLTHALQRASRPQRVLFTSKFLSLRSTPLEIFGS
jgi:hypothetical protein